MGCVCLFHVFLYSAVCPFYFAIILIRKIKRERAVCFNCFVFLVYFDCYWSVALPHSALGLSAVYGCGISLSYAPKFLNGKLLK